MQPIKLEDVPNPGGWEVAHEEDTGLYFIRAAKGTRLNRKYTTRNFAEKALHAYLVKMAQPPRPVGRPRKDGVDVHT